MTTTKSCEHRWIGFDEEELGPKYGVEGMYACMKCGATRTFKEVEEDMARIKAHYLKTGRWERV